MVSFLNTVAEFIITNHSESLKNSCIVFPNQRSSLYFFEEFKKLNKKATWLPKTYTINEFVHNIASLRVASTITQLTTLYQVHQAITKSGESFDKFFPWAQTILSDFGDIDKYLVDANLLLENVQDIKILSDSRDFLTPEQLKAIEEFFNIDTNSELKKRFLDIWHVLKDLYNQFNSALQERGYAYDGMVYREAAKKIKSDDFVLPYEKVFFVGFNAITRSEEVIFETLQRQGKALFFWDYDQSYISNDLHEAGLFLRSFTQKFKEPENYKANHDFKFKEKNINIISSPTLSGQMTIATDQLSKVADNEITDTALVLSDESLLMSMLEHTSPYLPEINVTMGYKIKNSVAGQWLELLIQLQNNKRTTDNGTSFFYKNVISILQHPFFMLADETFSVQFIQRIKDEAMFQLFEGDFENEFAQSVFKVVNTQSEFAEYLLTNLKRLITIFSEKKTDTDSWVLQQELVYRMVLQIQQLENEILAEALVIELPTYFQLLRKYINTLKVPFESDPVTGLQIMGFLETRCLDFKNLIILNVNEGTLPVNGNAPSFIPYSLRCGFKLPTHDEREAMYAYYFYRLLQRAENITLTYFTGKAEGKNGEPSRYILQLIYGNYNINRTALQSNIVFDATEGITMKKSELTKKYLSAYIDSPDNKEPKNLSPSSIITYVKCPIQFYFSKILRIDTDNDFDTDIDNRIFGNIFHSAMEDIYKDFVNKTVTKEDFEKLDKSIIKQKIDIAFIKSLYPKKYEDFIAKHQKGNFDLQERLVGYNKIAYNVISNFVDTIIKYDATQAPIKFLGLEKVCSITKTVNVGGNILNIRIGGTVDRIDECENTLRVVDYKTGGNEIRCKSTDVVFLSENIENYKGILQTLIYCKAVDKKYPGYDTVSAYLYKTKDIKTETSFKVCSKSGDEFETGNFKKIEDKVDEYLDNILKELFDENTPFEQTTNSEICEKCSFKSFCNK